MWGPRPTLPKFLFPVLSKTRRKSSPPIGKTSASTTVTMPASQVARPLARRLLAAPALRTFSLSAARPDTTTTTTGAPPADAATPDPNLDPSTVLGWKAEQALAKAGTLPVGSRRRRAALRAGPGVPFEQLPYQCFQEALGVIRADREEKVKAIQVELAKLARLEALPEGEGPANKGVKIASLRRHVEDLKILADINDPLVKRRFEDGLGKHPAFSSHSPILPEPPTRPSSSARC